MSIPAQKPADVLRHLRRRLDAKNKIWQPRNQQRTTQDAKLADLFDLLTARDPASCSYFSTLLHQVHNFFSSAKLTPDTFTLSPLEGGDLDGMAAQELNRTLRLTRQRGAWAAAQAAARADLIRGESFVLSGWVPNGNGRLSHLEYRHLPWENVRGFWGDADLFRLEQYSVERFISAFGTKTLKRVAPGDPLQGANFPKVKWNQLDTDQRNAAIIGVAHYYNPQARQYAVVMGGNDHLHTLLVGDNYPWTKDDNAGYCPVSSRVFYPPVTGPHGYGPMDLLFPLARLQTALATASANTMLDSSQPLRMVYTNDPDDAQKRYRQHTADRNAGSDQPLFLQEEGVGTRMRAETLDWGNNTSAFLHWQKFLDAQAAQRVGIDFGLLTTESPTAFQQNLRRQQQERASRNVLEQNRTADAASVLNDLHTLRSGESLFHDTELTFVWGEDEYRRTVRDIVTGPQHLTLSVNPQSEGVLEGMDALEVELLREAIRDEKPGTAAYSKLKRNFYGRILPEENLEEADFLREDSTASSR